MKTHKTITHPALRARMARALNELRHGYSLIIEDYMDERTKSIRWNRRWGIKCACARMAALEQELDSAQSALLLPADSWLCEPETNVELRQALND